jgi:cullin-4
MESSQFRNIIVAEVLDLIKLDRDNQQNVDIQLIQAILQMLIELSFYSTDFEPKFILSTNTYYKDESNQLIGELSVPNYIQHAYKRRFEESNDRIKNYLDLHTKQSLTNVVTNQLIYSKTEIIIKKGFDEMMTNNMEEPLKILYELLSTNATKINLLRIAFGEYIKKEGVVTIKDQKNDKEMILNLLRLKKRLDKILKNCFDNDVSFQNVLKESFEYFINTRGNKPAEMLAKFIDGKIKTSKVRGRLVD